MRAVVGVMTAVAALGVVGCGPRALVWSERTAAHDRVFLVDGRTDRRIVYREAGPVEARRTLLLIHGVGGSKADWMFTGPELAREYRVIAVDMLGHGDADKPRDAEYTMSAQAGRLRQLVRALELRDVVIVGASYGGGVALELATDLWASERERVAGLVLIGAAGLAFEAQPGYAFIQSPVLRELAVGLANGELLGPQLVAGSFHDRAAVPDGLRRQWARQMGTVAARRVMADAAVGLFAELHARADAAERYGGLGCRVLLLHGAEDEVVPVDVSRRLEAMLPDGRLMEMKACGHMPSWERVEETLAAVRGFVEGQEGNDGG